MKKRSPETKIQNEETAPVVNYPQKFGKYQVVREINRGGMGIVVEAFNRSLKQKVAMKILPKPLFTRERYSRFKREAKTMASIRHDNIARVFDYGEQEGYCYLVMDFIEGDNLEDYLVKTMPGVKELLSISEKTAMIINDLSKVNILHRDIKPSNIMIDKQGEVILVDFGICFNQFDEQEKENRLTREPLGTPVYMAPERLMSDADKADSVKADIYSLGIMMYRMFTGRVPFFGNSTGEVTKEILEGGIKPPRQINPKITRDLEYVILKAAAVNPEKRYENALLFAEDIAKVKNGGRYLNFNSHHFFWLLQRLFSSNWYKVILAVLILFTLWAVFKPGTKSVPGVEWSTVKVNDLSAMFNVYKDLEGETKVKATEQFLSYDQTRNRIVWLRNHPGFVISVKGSDSDYAVEFKTAPLRNNEMIGTFISSPEDFGGYFLKLENNKLSLCRNYYGNTIKQAEVDTKGHMRLRIERTGAQLKIYFNKEKLITFIDYSPIISKNPLFYGFFFNQGFRTLDDLKFETPKKPMMISPLVLGQRFYELGMLDNALAEYQKLLKEYPGKSIAFAASLRTAMILREQGKNQESIAVLQDLLEEKDCREQRPEILFQYGKSLFAAGQVQKAEQIFLEGLDAFPESEVRLNIFMFLQEKLNSGLEKFMVDNSLELDRQFYFLIRNFPENRPLLALSAKKQVNNYLTVSEDDKALSLLGNFEDFFPKQQSTLAWAHVMIGRLYLQQSSFNKAEKEFLHVINKYAGLGVYEKWALEGLLKISVLTKDKEKETLYMNLIKENYQNALNV